MLLLTIFLSVESKNEEYAIFNHVFENYNPEVRPSTVNEVIKVEIALSMQQMINLDEKRETVTISAFPEYTWVDRRLAWEPEKFNQQHTINMPVEKIWQPSIILYSNTDGIYDPTVPVMVPVKRNAGDHYFRFRIK